MGQSVESWQSFWHEGDTGQVESDITEGSVAVRAIVPYASASDLDIPQPVVVPTGERADLPA